MPANQQAFRAKRETWNRYFTDTNLGDAGPALASFFPDSALDAQVSRRDLFLLAAQHNLIPFVVATILWGYPQGMRGRHFENIATRTSDLILILDQARKGGIQQWDAHYFDAIHPIQGLGLSTYTKFLHFLKVRIQNYEALILDDRIVQVGARGIFSELAALRKLNATNRVKFYPVYLQVMHETADKLGVSAEKLELFIFEFGQNLKE